MEQANWKDLQRENERLLTFIQSRGYVRCDIPACNCNSFHGGGAMARLNEIYEALGDPNGVTALQTIAALQERVTALQSEREALEAEIEAACAECCRLCEVNEHPAVRGEDGIWLHAKSRAVGLRCAASPIRERRYQRQQV